MSARQSKETRFVVRQRKSEERLQALGSDMRGIASQCEHNSENGQLDASEQSKRSEERPPAEINDPSHGRRCDKGREDTAYLSETDRASGELLAESLAHGAKDGSAAKYGDTAKN